MDAEHRTARDGKPLRLLLVEDRHDDALLLLQELEHGGYAVSHRRVETVEALRSALASEDNWELVVSDYSLPTMTARDVLKVLNDVRPDLPCIVVSGTIGEEAAVEVLRAGARDFLAKGRLVRLLPAIQRELTDAVRRRRQIAAEAALREMRDRMQFALESIGIGVWESDPSRGRTSWTEVMERLHGLPPGTFGGTAGAATATIHADDRRIVHERVEAAVRDHQDLRLEYRTKWPDGSVHWILTIGRTVRDANGHAMRIGVALDITTQKHLEEQVQQTQKMESIGNLAGGIAHDFNNLLTVIIASSELVGERVPADTDAAEPLEEIRAAAMSASALTRQLLTFSRRQILVPVVVNLNEILEGFWKILRRLVEENVALEFRLAPEVVPVRVDPSQIEQVLLNLVANARDAMPDGGMVTIETSPVTVEAAGHSTHPDVPAGNYVLLSVSDTGLGMTPEVQTRLFEPFFTTKPRGRGTGLGLATVYGIVKASGGHISVHGQQGVGTSFRIYLPVASASTEAPLRQQQPPVVKQTGGETILIVEDNASLRRLTARVLAQHGYHVLVAPDGVQAQRICREHSDRIDVVLMDVIMPGESGPTVAEWIRQHRPGTKVIYMSGYAGDALDRHRVLDSSNVFLSKPFDTPQLLRAVRQALST
jgi:two-component system cell cycle sensor histidine kinase/response regulator CckA